MKSTETLRQLEACYQAFHPPQENSPEAFIWFSGIPHPFFNAVMHLSSEGNYQEKIDRIIQEAPSGLPYSFWILKDAKAEKIVSYLREKQFFPLFTCSLMRWTPQPVPLTNADIRPADMGVFNDILSTTFQFNEEVKKGFSNLMKKGKCENYLLFVEGQPVSTGTLTLQGYIAGVFNESILPQVQNKGYDHLVIQHLMKRAYELRIQQLVVLSVPDYESIYTRLGFERTGEVTLYVPQP